MKARRKKRIEAEAGNKMRRERKGENSPDDLHHVDIVGCVDALVRHDEVSGCERDDDDEDGSEPEESGGKKEVVVSAERSVEQSVSPASIEEQKRVFTH